MVVGAWLRCWVVVRLEGGIGSVFVSWRWIGLLGLLVEFGRIEDCALVVGFSSMSAEAEFGCVGVCVESVEISDRFGGS